MSHVRQSGQQRVFAQLARERRLQAPVLEQLRLALEEGDWVDPGCLGTFYEAELATAKAHQRGQGSFYTPDYLVDFVVCHTLSPLVEDLNLSEIKALRILDPSCGGGAFLLGALRFLVSRCVAVGAKPGAGLRRDVSGCLVGVDVDADALEVTRAALLMAVGSDSRATLVHGDALLPETHISQIDAVVGNPPWGQKNFKISSEKRRRYRELFSTACGVWDPFKLFVERAHQILRPGAYWGLVLPDIVLLKNLQEVRDVVLNGSAILEIAHAGQAFAGANIDAVAICARRIESKVGKRHSLRAWPQLKANWQDKASVTHRQKQSVFSELPGHRFNLYLHGDALHLYRRLRSLPRLGESFAMHEGVHTGNSRARLFLSTKGDGPARKVIVGGREMRPFSLCWKGTWLSLDPGAIDRSAGHYANLGRPEWHARNKVVVRRTGDRVMAAFDAHGYYVSNNLFVLLDTRVEQDAKKSMRFRMAIVSLLNSRFMTWYFRAIQPRRGRLFAELKLVHLRDFPLPVKEQWAKVEARLAQLAHLASKGGAEAIACELNALVESAYEISPRECEVIRLSE